jgi:hypothetical protein
MSSKDTISLADTVAGLREELEIAAQRQDAAVRAGDKRLVPPLQLTNIVIETEVLVGRDQNIGGKVGYWIATAEAAQTNKNSAKVKVTLNLTPLDRINPETGAKESLVLGDEEAGADVT